MLFLWLILLQLVVFAVLVLFLRVILTRNVSSATAHLNELNEECSQKLEEAKKKLENAGKHYDETVLKAKIDAEKAKALILKEAQEAKDAVLNDARRESQDILEKANKTREALFKEFDEKLQKKSMEVACEVVKEILPELITKELHEKWVEELSKHGLDDLNRLYLPDNLKEAEVTSAYKLEPEQKMALQKKILDKLARELRFHEEVDSGLIAGIRVKLGSVVIDGSMKFKIEEMARHAKHAG